MSTKPFGQGSFFVMVGLLMFALAATLALERFINEIRPTEQTTIVQELTCTPPKKTKVPQSITFEWSQWQMDFQFDTPFQKGFTTRGYSYIFLYKMSQKGEIELWGVGEDNKILSYWSEDIPSGGSLFAYPLPTPHAIYGPLFFYICGSQVFVDDSHLAQEIYMLGP